ncbi:MAG: terpene cyclase/mutase family protein [bacterium]|nr:terpene cyclase/mutase family protein [bacterium]
MSAYLQQLTIRLATGVAALGEERIERHANYFLNQQKADGGFGGRMTEEASDLYYTAFGLRSLAILGRLYDEPAERAAGYLRSRLQGQESIVDFLSLVYASAQLEAASGLQVFADAPDGWRESIAAKLEELRRPDGGYAKGLEGKASSTYQTFLVLLCLELIEQPMPDPEKAIEFVLSRRHEEGGFQEIRVSKRAGTNPTAAGIGCLKILGGLNEDISEETIDFLLDMQTDEGGMRANTRIPIADVLSTFTGMLTLQDLGAADELELDEVEKYVQSLELPAGGFHAAAWDEQHDVEYTFYGIGCLALLNQIATD